MVRAVATWFVFVLVCVIGVFTLFTRPKRKPLDTNSEFHPRPLDPGANIVRHGKKSHDSREPNN